MSVVGQSIQCRLPRVRCVRRKENSSVDPRLAVDTLLGIQMNTARADIADFHGVVLKERVLTTERVLKRLWIQLVHNDVVRGGKSLCGDTGISYDATRSRRDAAACEEAPAGGTPRVTRAVHSTPQLRRQGQNADVVIENAITNAQRSANHSIPAAAPRVYQSHHLTQ